MSQNNTESQHPQPDGTPVRSGISSCSPFSGAIFSRLSSLCRWHIATAILLIALFVFMANRSRDEDRWSDWGFGDAQTMLSLKHWDKEGWISNYLLFIPQGYAK